MTKTETTENPNAFLKDLDDALFINIYQTARMSQHPSICLTEAQLQFLADTQAERKRRGLVIG